MPPSRLRYPACRSEEAAAIVRAFGGDRELVTRQARALEIRDDAAPSRQEEPVAGLEVDAALVDRSQVLVHGEDVARRAGQTAVQRIARYVIAKRRDAGRIAALQDAAGRYRPDRIQQLDVPVVDRRMKVGNGVRGQDEADGHRVGDLRLQRGIAPRLVVARSRGAV